jgi:hypothetical protein
MERQYTDALREEQLAPGTRLIIGRWGYRHHGVYVGDGHVVHYAGRFSYPHGLVEEISLPAFIDGLPLALGQAPHDATDGELVVRRARSRLGERRYDVVSNNCEHFCNWCQAGEHRSEQIDSLNRPLRLVVRTLETVASGITAATWAASSAKSAFLYEGGHQGSMEEVPSRKIATPVPASVRYERIACQSMVR